MPCIGAPGQRGCEDFVEQTEWRTRDAGFRSALRSAVGVPSVSAPRLWIMNAHVNQAEVMLHVISPALLYYPVHCTHC